MAAGPRDFPPAGASPCVQRLTRLASVSTIPAVRTAALRSALVELLRPPLVASVGAGGLLLSVSTGGAAASSAPGGGATRAGGDTIVLDQLIDELSPAVYRLARSVVRDPGLADDVTQETFIKVWKHLDDYRGDGSVKGWVLRIAHNTAVSTLRRVKDTATDPDRLPHAHEPISTNRVVEGRLAHGELQEALDALDGLSREIVVLREVEGLTYEEIAGALDVPIPTVKTRLLRARRRLAAALEGWRG